MSVPTGAGNYPPGVTDNDPHFESDPDNLEVSLEHPGALSNLPHDEECRHNPHRRGHQGDRAYPTPGIWRHQEIRDTKPQNGSKSTCGQH